MYWFCLRLFSLTPPIYAGVGNFTKVSNNLQPSGSANLGSAEYKAQLPLLPVAAAITAAYFAGYVVGRVAHYAWNSFIMLPANDASMQMAQYNSNDFSSFDN